MRRRGLLVLSLLSPLVACAGPPPAGRAAAAEAGGGENVAAIRLRVVARQGARFLTRSVARTESMGSVALSESRGRMEVVGIDAATGDVRVVSHVDSIRLTDASGAPLPSPSEGAFDLSGVTFHRTMSDRARVIGEVRVEGAGAANAGFAETMRSTLQQTTIELPEAPVRVGDAWTDHTDARVPIEQIELAMRCTTRYRLTDVEGTGDARLAVIAFESECDTEPATIPGAEGTGPIEMSIVTRAVGTQRVALADGMSGVVTTRTESDTTLRPAGGEPMSLHMLQEVETTFSPALE